MRPLRHGYTNDTRGDGVVIVKRYAGPEARIRRQRERAILRELGERLPVPPLIGDDDGDGELRLGFIAGAHGQELIDAGWARPVLRSCGDMLRQVHAIDVTEVLPDASPGSGGVLVHGDYGPNNVLLDPATCAVTAVLDWEWVHVGHAVEDLAWCEWIVRMHHSEHVDALEEFFDGYGHRPAWTKRQDAMLVQCQMLLDFCQRWESGGDGERLWRHRLDVTSGWTE